MIGYVHTFPAHAGPGIREATPVLFYLERRRATPRSALLIVRTIGAYLGKPMAAGAGDRVLARMIRITSLGGPDEAGIITYKGQGFEGTVRYAKRCNP